MHGKCPNNMYYTILQPESRNYQGRCIKKEAVVLQNNLIFYVSTRVIETHVTQGSFQWYLSPSPKSCFFVWNCASEVQIRLKVSLDWQMAFMSFVGGDKYIWLGHFTIPVPYYSVLQGYIYQTVSSRLCIFSLKLRVFLPMVCSHPIFWGRCLTTLMAGSPDGEGMVSIEVKGEKRQ